MRPVKVALALQRLAAGASAGFSSIACATSIDGQPPVAVRRDEQPVVKLDLGLRHVEHLRGYRLGLRDHVVRGLDHQRAAEPHRAVRMRAAARRDLRGVAADELDVFRMHAEQIGHHLREARLVTLAGRLRADREFDLAGAAHRDLDALVRNADRRLDDSSRCRCRAACRASSTSRSPRGEALPVGDLDHARHVAGEIAAVVEQPARGAIRQLLVRDDVLLADAQPVHAELCRRRDRSAAPAPTSPRAGRRRGTARSARCWSSRRGSACASAECHRRWWRRDRRCSAAHRSPSARRMVPM